MESASSAAKSETAIDVATTRSAIRSSLNKSVATSCGGFALALIAVGLDPEASNKLLSRLGALGLVLWVAGLIAIGVNRFINGRLKRAPWTEWHSTFCELPSPAGVTPNGTPIVQLFDRRKKLVYTLSIFASPGSWQSLRSERGLVWFCGDPSRSGVVSPVGGGKPMLVQRPLLNRGRLTRKAMEAANRQSSGWRDGADVAG